MADAPVFSKWPALVWNAVSLGLVGSGVSLDWQQNLLIVAGIIVFVFSNCYALARWILLAERGPEDTVLKTMLLALERLGGLSDGYRTAVRRALLRFDRFLGDDVTERGDPNRPDLKSLLRRDTHPLSLGSYDFCLKLALAYPLVFMFFYGFCSDPAVLEVTSLELHNHGHAPQVVVLFFWCCW